VSRVWRNLASTLALAAVVYLMLAFLSGVDDLRRALDRFEWALVPVALALVGASYAVRYARWSYYLRLLGIHPARRIDVAIFAAGLAMTISPGKLGEAIKSVFILQTSGDPVAKTAPVVVAERATDAVGVVVWGLLGALAFGFGPGVLVGSLAITLVGILALRSERLSALVSRLLDRVAGLRHLVPHVSHFHGASDRLFSPAALGVGSTLSIGAWGLEMMAAYLSIKAVGATVSFLEVSFIFAMSSFVGALTPLPGGIGAVEVSLAGMLRAVAGLTSGQAAAATFVVRLVTLWFAVLVGVVGLVSVRRVAPRPDRAH
jgi:uncharacterized protein (TIRG00374 family)